MAHSFQLAEFPGLKLPVKNYGVTDIAESTPLQLDTTNAIGTNPAANGIGVIPIAAIGNVVMGVAGQTIPAGGTGNCWVTGVKRMVADGAITAGQVVDGSNAVGKGARAHANGEFSIGVALTTAADGEELLVLLNVGANNA